MSFPLYRYISRLRWLVLVVGFTLITVHQLLEGYGRGQDVLHWELIELIYEVIVTLSIWFILTKLGTNIQEIDTLHFRELDMLSRLQGTRTQAHLQDDLTGVLADTVTALEADGGVLFLADLETAVIQAQAEVGRPLGEGLALIQGLAVGAIEADSPIIIQELEAAKEIEARSLLIAPMQIRENTLGSLVIWSAKIGIFGKRRAKLVATVAGQTALLIENHRLYIYGETHAILAERARLAREIHDGLAQTIGYLKLQISQITNWLENGKSEQATTSLNQVKQMLNDAYIDAREAIDSLHLNSNADDLPAWINEIATAFEATSNIPIVVTLPPEISLPPEVQIQLQRIVQEALNNIRKHADATRTWLEWQLDAYWLTLKISDNGQGFDLDDLSPDAPHGLRIMRERADLLEADFQISSQADNGTQIIVRLPLIKKTGEAQYV
ncbi:MAG: hypothetical protein GY943_38225 [Chloroflexi bacterium]|nr:hypothetical protein [Chloroflexota bacterium]